MENTTSTPRWHDGLDPIPSMMINIEGIFNLRWELKKIIQNENAVDLIISKISELYRAMVEEGVKLVSKDDYDTEDLYMPQFTLSGFEDCVKVDILCCLGICSSIDIKPKQQDIVKNN